MPQLPGSWGCDGLKIGASVQGRRVLGLGFSGKVDQSSGWSMRGPTAFVVVFQGYPEVVLNPKAETLIRPSKTLNPKPPEKAPKPFSPKACAMHP